MLTIPAVRADAVTTTQAATAVLSPALETAADDVADRTFATTDVVEKAMITIERRLSRLMRKVHQVAEITGLRKAPRRVVFMHVPKCAGSSINWAAKSYLGSSRSSKVVLVDDTAPAHRRREQIARAKDALFVGGHFGFETLEKVRDDAYVFTILRDPYERLRSAYGFLTALAKRNPLPEHLRHLSVDAFMSSTSEPVLQWSDNVIARALAQTWDRKRATCASTDALAAAAIANLQAFDHIGFVDTLDEDMLRVAQAANMLPLAKMGRRNSTKSHLGKSERPEALSPLTDRLRSKAFHLVRADLRVYEAALRLRGLIPAVEQTRPAGVVQSGFGSQHGSRQAVTA